MPQVTRYWNDVAHSFDAIYRGKKSPIGRALERWFRKDVFQRFDGGPREMRQFASGRFLSAWPRFWTWRMPLRNVRLQYIQACPVFLFRKQQVHRMLEASRFEVDRCDTVGKPFCVDAHTV